MFYDSNSFKVLEAGVQLTLMQQQLSTQNVANSETAGYKSKSLSFQTVLKNAENENETPQIAGIEARVETSNATSNRADGNNVDAEKEYLSLYKDYAQYSMLLDKVKSEFKKYDSVLDANL